MNVDLFKHPIAFRLPSDAPEPAVEYLIALKEKEGRAFSRHVYALLLKAIQIELSKEDGKEYIMIPLPENLSMEQRNLLNQATMRQFIGDLLPVLLNKPSDVLQTAGNMSAEKQEPIPSAIQEKYRNTFLADLFADVPGG